ncbi:unnamed protein product [Dicrocoelium dendriticum]|nr:unnamed protein product [Dicrocoelium dendriticum]
MNEYSKYGSLDSVLVRDCSLPVSAVVKQQSHYAFVKFLADFPPVGDCAGQLVCSSTRGEKAALGFALVEATPWHRSSRRRRWLGRKT